MKINSLYIASFGGIKNLKLDFSDNFNIIYGNNEDGKSTVMAFIKMMFYGSERGGNTLSKNIRKKYTPWDASSMAGSIDFEHGGKKYRLEKEFRTSNSTDKATLYDLKLSEKVNVSGDIGQKFFGLSMSAFERSVFIGQFGFPENDSDAEGEISGKLSNLALTGDENVSFEAVNARLQKAKLSLMSKSGRAGEYDKNIKLLSDTEEQISVLDSMKAELENKQQSAEILKTEIEQMQKKAEELKVKISAEQDIRNAEKLRNLLELKDNLEQLNKTLALKDGGIIDEMYLRKLKFCISKCDTAKAKVDSKQNEIELLEKSIKAGLNPPENATEENAQKLNDELKRLETELDAKTKEAEALNTQSEAKNKETELAKNKRQKFNKPLVFGGVTVLILGIVLFAVNVIAGTVGSIAGLVLTALGFVIRPLDTATFENLKAQGESINAKLLAVTTEQNTLSVKLSSVAAKLEAINAALNATSAVLENQQKMLETAKMEFEALNSEYVLEKNTLTELLKLYKTYDSQETEEILEEITKTVESQNKIKTELSVYLKELDGISYDDAREKLAKISETVPEITEDFEEIKKNFSSLLSDIADKKSQYATIVAEAKNYKSATEKLDDLKKKREKLKDKTAKQKEFCDIADLAMVTLAESFAEVHSSYGAVLEQKAAEIFGSLTLGKYKDMYISKSFGIDVGESNAFGRREIGFLSSGAADQGYLSLRLALSSLMSAEGEALPVMLDDSLAQYDDNRTDAALEFLKEYSKNSQVIMFTCHNDICEKAKNIGITSQNLKPTV